jgi:exonuclease III
MRVITWNCNLKFAKKYEFLEAYNADLVIIQECERLPEDYFPNRKFFWTGRIESKGLGILIKDPSARLHSDFNPNLINFLPIETDALRVLGIWAYNHRAVKFGDDVSGNTIDAINYYRQWLQDDSHPCLVGGDFNNSVIWDKPNNENNFANINKKLEEMSLKSSYHSFQEEEFGNEVQPTFFHTKNESKKYHIDYLYSKSLKLNTVEVGEYSDWIQLSDHCPVMTEFKIP